MTCPNYAVADWSSLGHVIVTRHCMKNKGRPDLTNTVLNLINEHRGFLLQSVLADSLEVR